MVDSVTLKITLRKDDGLPFSAAEAEHIAKVTSEVAVMVVKEILERHPWLQVTTG